MFDKGDHLTPYPMVSNKWLQMVVTYNMFIDLYSMTAVYSSWDRKIKF